MTMSDLQGYQATTSQQRRYAAPLILFREASELATVRLYTEDRKIKLLVFYVSLKFM